MSTLNNRECQTKLLTNLLPGWLVHWNFDGQGAPGVPGQGPDGSSHSVQRPNGTSRNGHDWGNRNILIGTDDLSTTFNC